MTDLQLLALIGGGSALIVGVFCAGFYYFSRFLKTDREREERLRDLRK